MPSTLGVITARGGSKGIAGKNVRLLAGQPLIAYTIRAATEAGVFERLIVSTDDPTIADVARRLDCEVPFLRPAELARGDTPHLPVMQHAVAWLRDSEGYCSDLVVILQPTSPLRRADHIRGAIDLLLETRADSVVSVGPVPAHYHPLRTVSVDQAGMATLFTTGEPIRRRVNRRQELSPVWAINGAVYVFRSELLSGDDPTLYGNRTAAYLMSARESISLDEPDDWREAERLLEQDPIPRLQAG